MIQKTPDWTLIARFITDNASPEDRRYVLDWALVKPENQQTLQDAIKVWKHSGVRVSPPIIEPETEWEEFKTRIKNHVSSPGTQRHGKVVRLMIVTAGLIALAVIVIYFISRDRSEQVKQRLNHLTPQVLLPYLTRGYKPIKE